MWNLVKKHIFISSASAVFLIWCLFLLLCIVPGGEMTAAFTCLGALFTGLAFAGTISALFSQERNLSKQSDHIKAQAKNLEEQEKRLKEQEKRNIRQNYMEMIDRISETKGRLSGKTWSGHDMKAHQVVEASLEYVPIVLESYHDYFLNKNIMTGEAAEQNFNVFYEKYLKTYLPVSSQVLYYLRTIIKDESLSDKEKEDLYNYMIFNLTPEDKQLLNLVFMRKEVAHDLEYFHKEFNEGQVRRQLKLQNDDISWNAINAFIASLQVMHPVT